jgi:L-seryl-tRNA(Ser) seleniumtransferase
VGFAESPEIAAIASLAHAHGRLAIHDIGSGCLHDLSEIAGLPAEPTFRQSLAAGADLVLGSGDKLLGGPQCGILLGSEAHINKVRQHPLARAVRIDKLTLAALAATLDLYRQGRERDEIPVLALLTASADALKSRAVRIHEQLGDMGLLKISIRESVAPVGGGSFPTAQLPTAVLCLEHATLGAEVLARRLRLGKIHVVGRIQHDQLLLDLRSVDPLDDSQVVEALRRLANPNGGAVSK